MDADAGVAYVSGLSADGLVHRARLERRLVNIPSSASLVNDGVHSAEAKGSR